VKQIIQLKISDERLRPATFFSNRTEIIVDANTDEALREFADQYPLYERVGLQDSHLKVNCDKFGDIAKAQNPDTPIFIPFVSSQKLVLISQSDSPYAEQYCADYIRSPYDGDEEPFVRKVHEFKVLVTLPEVLSFFIQNVRTHIHTLQLHFPTLS
jgi:hypothetical protein